MTESGRLLAELIRRNATILVVDERAETRAMTRDFFTELGSRVVCAANLPAAAHVLRTVSVQLVMACYENSRAHQAASALRACARAVPIIALTADAGTLRALLAALGRALAAADAEPKGTHMN
jgi:CheY-like chemotaxis protein